MKLISLNTWGGRAGKDLQLSFFKKHNDMDVFCLQEMWRAPYQDLEGFIAGGLTIDHSTIMVYGVQEISKLLYEHEYFFKPQLLNDYGIMMLIKKNLTVTEEGEIYVYKEKGYLPPGDVGNHARNIQYATIETKNGPVTIINFHGLWNGKGKTDSEDRIMQSQNIINFLKTLNNPLILCGDFNLLPDTKSIRMFEEFGLRNLIKELGIASTRTSYYKKPEKHADYCFVSKNIKVKEFKVLPDEVSDHSPLYLDFEA